MRRSALCVLAVLLGALPARAGTGFEPLAPPPALGTSVLVSPLALQAGSISSFGDSSNRKSKKKRPAEEVTLGPERARILLRSLTVPGWGQASLGRRHAAATFAVLEAGIWTAFTTYRIQEQLRIHSYEVTARLFAGIDLRGRDEEFRRIVGAFSSSDEYNLLVVARDAANQFLSNPTAANMAAYRAYIASHSLSGADAWNWANEAAFDRYGAQRRDAQRASINANAALAVAIANRLLSALHAAHAAGHAPKASPPHTSWNFDVSPGDPGEPILFRAGVHARF